MKVNSLVLCILGSPGILEENAIYTVREITAAGHINLFEAVPPHPHNCFNRERFVEVQSSDDATEILSEVYTEMIEDSI